MPRSEFLKSVVGVFLAPVLALLPKAKAGESNTALIKARKRGVQPRIMPKLRGSTPNLKRLRQEYREVWGRFNEAMSRDIRRAYDVED